MAAKAQKEDVKRSLSDGISPAVDAKSVSM